MIGHRCANHEIDPGTESLIIGTFNPDTKSNEADFFYGRPRNRMWEILPTVFGEASLKGATREAKLRFIRDHHIDFIDLIWEIEPEPLDYRDTELERVTTLKWRDDIFEEMDKLQRLKRVAVSRKGFRDVPKIGQRVRLIEARLQQRTPIVFRCVHTPARGYRRALEEWKEFLLET